jgi:hypothetical protein
MGEFDKGIEPQQTRARCEFHREPQRHLLLWDLRLE